MSETPAVPAPPPPPYPAPVCEHVSRGSISGTVPPPGRRVVAAPRALIAEDDPVSRTLLDHTLRGWGYDVVVTRDGNEAWAALLAEDAPNLAILDWMMPGLEGPEVCRRVRALAQPIPTYVILLTARGQSDDIVAGLESGADDYVTKPFDRQELRSRIRVGERVLALQRGLADRVRDLEAVLGQVKELKGLLPICSYCKAVRDDQNYWHRVETYITAHSAARFSHGICPGCWKGVVEPELASIEAST
ncbi:Transcriptional activator protein CopR [Gemmata sp. SH-PL17]|uniref:response regulator transcription factor n=1 Tax=Gemmata sp. SH-PL17 TaxID=1630693 RepID=UPI0004B1F04D|nr:response regulator [Gemmata sp. SH-PL17]AMV28407.1 Transcriptional activator protein CopR [Gemmata sp. SH-PL17]